MIRSIIEKRIPKGKNIGIWGAGGFGVAALTLYEIPSSKVLYFIDSDPQKWGMEYLSFSIPIISPNELKENEPDLLIIASMYAESIVKEIEKKEIKCSILSLFPEVSFSN